MRRGIPHCLTACLDAGTAPAHFQTSLSILSLPLGIVCSSSELQSSADFLTEFLPFCGRRGSLVVASRNLNWRSSRPLDSILPTYGDDFLFKPFFLASITTFPRTHSPSDFSSFPSFGFSDFSFRFLFLLLPNSTASVTTLNDAIRKKNDTRAPSDGASLLPSFPQFFIFDAVKEIT